MEKAVASEQPVAAGEFERQPVPSSQHKSWKKFLGMYAGEHAAGTEFVIGPLFLTAGVSAFDLIVGLILGNFLAVLTWRYVTTPIATAERLTLYYSRKKTGNRIQPGQWASFLLFGWRHDYGFRYSGGYSF